MSEEYRQNQESEENVSKEAQENMTKKDQGGWQNESWTGNRQSSWQNESWTQNNQSSWQNSGAASQSGQAWQSSGAANQSGQAWQNSGAANQNGQAWQSSGAANQNRQTWQYTGQERQMSGKEEKKARKAQRRQERKEMRKSYGVTAGKMVAVALCSSLLGGLVGAGGILLGSMLLSPGQGQEQETNVLEGSRPNTVITMSSIDTSKVMTPAEVYAENVNSTVGITTSITTTNFWGYQTTSPASGSGFILTEDGYVITNQHVIDSANSITVTTYDGTTYDAKLVGYDASNDVAVLKVDATGLTPVVLGDSDNSNVGDSVAAIGNPLGELTFSMATGSISALNRSITLSSGTTMDLMQVDCAINAGNSGGALFNMYGEVIGITNAKYSNNGDSSQASIENIGFAIPINHVKDIIQSIIEKGYISKPYIGVGINNVSEEMQAYGIPQGAAVVTVEEDGPAAKAGLQENDIITKVNDKDITSADDLIDAVGATAAGDELKVTIYRQGETLTLTVTVEENRQSALEEEEDNQDSQGSQGSQGGQGGQGSQQEDIFGFPWSFPFGF